MLNVPLHRSNHEWRRGTFHIPIFSVQALEPVQAVLDAVHGVLNDPAIDVDAVCRRNDLHKGLAALDAKKPDRALPSASRGGSDPSAPHPGRSAAGDLLQLLSGNDGALRRKSQVLLHVRSSQSARLASSTRTTLPAASPIVVRRVSGSTSFPPPLPRCRRWQTNGHRRWYPHQTPYRWL